MKDTGSSSATPSPVPGVIFDLVEPSSNTSLTIADHLLVSREAQAIMGGVVGFWGGVFGMGSVYLLVVFLRRFRKALRHRRNNAHLTGPSFDKKISAGYSAMFGPARNTPNIDLMDFRTQQQQLQVG